MKSFIAMRRRTAGVAAPPDREDTYGTTNRQANGKQRAPKTGRTEQFNTRGAVGFGDRVRELAKRERATLGEILESMLVSFEAAGAGLESAVPPVAEVRAGRKREVMFWATEYVYQAIGKVAAAREMSVSELLEELLAHEVHRLDPHGGRFGVYVKR